MASKILVGRLGTLGRGAPGLRSLGAKRQMSGETLAQFPGAKAAYTDKLQFIHPDETIGIPIYRSDKF